jgi:hypothetical protein
MCFEVDVGYITVGCKLKVGYLAFPIGSFIWFIIWMMWNCDFGFAIGNWIWKYKFAEWYSGHAHVQVDALQVGAWSECWGPSGNILSIIGKHGQYGLYGQLILNS